jgi:hypothetical protein
MIGVTVFGLIFTPLFYVLASRFAGRRREASLPDAASGQSPPTA